MARWAVGDTVRVAMPRGENKRRVVGISVLYSTWPQARFDGAVGTIAEINPRGTHGIPLFLVNFRGHDNRVAIPWMSEWFREEWLQPVTRPAEKKGDESAKAAPAAEQAAAPAASASQPR